MIILMINYYYWCYWNPIQRPKRQNNLILVKRKKHDQNTSNYRTRNQKLLQQVFARKNMIMLLFKESKIPILKNIKLIVDSGYQGIQKSQ
ncbi:hypothetical protein [Spiroplasma poulsonii]|uniref:hypothetical protein n=1 Tax=Spiroplasma poulsonii TaxID=2138 RepID=UPI001F4D2E9D|nr:hypothetical protein [Spiroplasma poulsonii]UNF62560.1 hypothetical protein MNU24_03650 [Spiroplasma poulsonii]